MQQMPRLRAAGAVPGELPAFQPGQKPRLRRGQKPGFARTLMKTLGVPKRGRRVSMVTFGQSLSADNTTGYGGEPGGTTDALWDG